jgi:signal transduction histidine kinase
LISAKPPRTQSKRDAELRIDAALQQYIQQGPLPFAVTRGADHKLFYANAAFCRLADIGAAAFGTPIVRAFGAIEGPALATLLDQAFQNVVQQLDARVAESSERARRWSCSVWPVLGDDRQVEALGIEIREVEPTGSALEFQRRIAEQMLLGALRERELAEDAEAARRRAAFLAEAGRLLAESLDQSSTLIALTKLALPTLGAWCIVDVLKEGDAIQRLGIYHADPEKQQLAHEMEFLLAPQPDDQFGAAAMLRSPTPTAITDNVEASLAAGDRRGDTHDLLRQLGVGSLLTVPLIARGNLLGAVTFVSEERGRPYAATDVQLAEDLAHRAALALDNAQMYEMAVALRHSAETANTAKTAFLGAMSHELRTPLNAIGGYIDLLDMGLRGPVTAEQHADFARVKTSQQHLTLLITEILNFARSARGGISYAVADLNIGDTMAHAIALVEPLFGQKGIVFDGIAGEATIVARGDSERVTQVLVNLLSNAIKFTPTGGHIGAECAATADTALLRVTDTGPGIPAAKLETIFEPFVQLREGLSDREGGVGLGLAISRDLARAMNGGLTVESVVGTGSRFTLNLPLAKDG